MTMNHADADALSILPDTVTSMSRRQALWRSAALAAAGLLVPSLARAQEVPVDAEAPAAPVDSTTPAEVEAVDPEETLDWSVDPGEQPAAGAEAAYFEAARANEAADLADADEVHAESLEAAAIEFRHTLAVTREQQVQETEESALESAITLAALDAEQIAALTAKLEAIRETYRLRQEQLVKARHADRASEQDAKRTSKQVRRRSEAARKQAVSEAHNALLQELRTAPARFAQEARHKQRSQLRQAKRLVSEQAAKARMTRTADRTALGAQEQGLATMKESLLLQRAARIKNEARAKRNMSESMR